MRYGSRQPHKIRLLFAMDKSLSKWSHFVKKNGATTSVFFSRFPNPGQPLKRLGVRKPTCFSSDLRPISQRRPKPPVRCRPKCFFRIYLPQSQNSHGWSLRASLFFFLTSPRDWKFHHRVKWRTVVSVSFGKDVWVSYRKNFRFGYFWDGFGFFKYLRKICNFISCN